MNRTEYRKRLRWMAVEVVLERARAKELAEFAVEAMVAGVDSEPLALLAWEENAPIENALDFFGSLLQAEGIGWPTEEDALLSDLHRDLDSALKGDSNLHEAFGRHTSCGRLDSALGPFDVLRRHGLEEAYQSSYLDLCPDDDAQPPASSPVDSPRVRDLERKLREQVARWVHETKPWSLGG